MLSFECVNPIFGRTLNPWSAAHTCGGSSGGEAALLASSGSALGVGSDIGGSLRIPTAFCGIYSLKPGAGRISKAGAACKDGRIELYTVRQTLSFFYAAPSPGFEGIQTVMGPMGRCVLHLFRFAVAEFALQIG